MGGNRYFLNVQVITSVVTTRTILRTAAKRSTLKLANFMQIVLTLSTKCELNMAIVEKGKGNEMELLFHVGDTSRDGLALIERQLAVDRN